MLLLFRIVLLFGFVVSVAQADVIMQFGDTIALSTSSSTGDVAVFSLSEADLEKRRIIEINDMAGIMCKMIGLIQSDITKAILAIILAIMGLGAYLGKISIGLIISFFFGVGLFFNLTSLLSLFGPFSDIAAGCRCRRYVAVAYDINLGYIYGDMLLNFDCTKCPDANSCK